MPSSNANFCVKMVAFLLVKGRQHELERELNILSKSSSSWSILKCDWVPAPAHEIWTSSWTCVHWSRSSNTLVFLLCVGKCTHIHSFHFIAVFCHYSADFSSESNLTTVHETSLVESLSKVSQVQGKLQFFKKSNIVSIKSSVSWI